MKGKTYIAPGRFVDPAELDVFESAARAKKLGDGFTVHVKSDLTETSSNAASLIGTDAGNQYGGVVARAYREFAEAEVYAGVVADAIGTTPVDSNAVVSVRGPAADEDDDTAEVDEGNAPEMTLEKLTPAVFPLRDTVNLLAVSEDFLADSPHIMNYLDRRLRRLALRREEKDLINGSGTTPQRVGLLNTVGRTTGTRGADDLDVALVKLQMDVFTASGSMASVIILSPNNWASVLTNTTSGNRKAGGSALINARQLFGARVVISPYMGDTHALVVGPDFGVVARHSSGLTISTSPEYDMYWGEGLVAVKGKLRSALVAEIPAAVGDLTL